MIKETLKRYKEKTDKEIDLFLEKELKTKEGFLKESYKTINRYINAGGKRIRPTATLLAYRELKGDEKDMLLPAIAIEFLHNSTLCHDDIMDEDVKRRNNPSCHKDFQNFFLDNFKENSYAGDIFSKESIRFGVSVSIIAGNIFNLLGYKAISDSNFNDKIKKEAVSRMTEIMTEVNHGQILDMLYEKKKEVTEKEYIDMISKKTAFLLGGSFELGAIFADAEKKARDAFFDYGFNLGLGFQIADDLMDIDPESKKGNSFGSDIKKGKMTLIAIKAIEKDKKVKKILEKENKTDKDIKSAVKLFKESGAINYARNLAEEKIDIAKKSIKKITNNPLFIELADYMVNRNI